MVLLLRFRIHIAQQCSVTLECFYVETLHCLATKSNFIVLHLNIKILSTNDEWITNEKSFWIPVLELWYNFLFSIRKI